jgi:hypothetical protein
MKTGDIITDTMKNRNVAKYPLRKVIALIQGHTNSRDLVRLECGHEIYCYGGIKARCHKCAKRLPPDAKTYQYLTEV